MEEKEYILSEANRCLQCPNPSCEKGCPLGNNIKKVIEYVKNEEFELAYKEITKKNIMPEICSRVCPHYEQCEGNCILGKKGQPIRISKIEKYVSDLMIEKRNNLIRTVADIKEDKVAVIGSGPSGIGCAYYLAKKGYDVTIFERESSFGGTLKYGIPNFRLGDKEIQTVLKKLIDLDVKFRFDTEFGDNVNINSLEKEGFKAIFLGIGLDKPKMLNVPGEDLLNVLDSAAFLYDVNTNYEEYVEFKNSRYRHKSFVIIGGGDVAMDCARTAIRLGAKEVKVIYRRTEKEMPVSPIEYEHAINEGVEFEYLTLPVKILGENKVEKVECVKMKLGDLDESGRPKPILVENSNFEINTNFVITSLGNKLNQDRITNKFGIEIDEQTGLIKINEKMQTNIQYVFAGGDATNKVQKVAYAEADGIKAGKEIEKYLLGDK
ncbi:MAG: FAD-dependent oxidoreductase [Clostridiales bacterium]|nr:FAD-dependent oxidoreductase [Clostridiales bacterium]